MCFIANRSNPGSPIMSRCDVSPLYLLSVGNSSSVFADTSLIWVFLMFSVIAFCFCALGRWPCLVRQVFKFYKSEAPRTEAVYWGLVCAEPCLCVFSFQAWLFSFIVWADRGLGGLRIYLSWALPHACWCEDNPVGLKPGSKSLISYLPGEPLGFLSSEQAGSWKLEKQASWVHSPCLPQSPLTQPTGQGKLF